MGPGAPLALGSVSETGKNGKWATSEAQAPCDRGSPETAALIAASQGLPIAQFYLGVLYANGQGVPKDLVQSYMWLKLSAARGYSEAKKAQQIVSGQMTEAQIAEAQKLGQEWKPTSAQQQPALLLQ